MHLLNLVMIWCGRYLVVVGVKCLVYDQWHLAWVVQDTLTLQESQRPLVVNEEQALCHHSFQSLKTNFQEEFHCCCCQVLSVKTHNGPFHWPNLNVVMMKNLFNVW